MFERVGRVEHAAGGAADHCGGRAARREGARVVVAVDQFGAVAIDVIGAFELCVNPRLTGGAESQLFAQALFLIDAEPQPAFSTARTGLAVGVIGAVGMGQHEASFEREVIRSHAGAIPASGGVYLTST